MMRALLDRFDVIEATAEPEWSGGGPVHNVGVSVNRLPVRVTPRRGGNEGEVNSP